MFLTIKILQERFYMLQTKIKESFVEKSTDEILKSIKKTIRNSKTSNMTIDISMLNPMDAIKVSTAASTYHFLKFGNTKINWIVCSKEVEKLIKPFNLGNSLFQY